ncbi:hypothetical protein U9M48_018613 [Paspalum notatum var. saurae]|uniref:Methyltransferase type 11 domain-containing protein n=1 Tax=Paspalum notatum var. saurae TaxID=547442 RepID=A0AAQ3WPY5_PASNO
MSWAYVMLEIQEHYKFTPSTLWCHPGDHILPTATHGLRKQETVIVTSRMKSAITSFQDTMNLTPCCGCHPVHVTTLSLSASTFSRIGGQCGPLSTGTGDLDQVSKMAGLFTEQAAVYAAARPAYPKDLFSKLAGLTAHRRRAWDVGTGNGQAAISVAEHYDSVVATDMDAEQLRHAVTHPKVQYLHTPDDTAPKDEDDLVSTLGGEGSVDLITVAQAVHWFDLPAFYGVAQRVLRRPGGVIAVWGYNHCISPVDMMARFCDTTLPYWDPRARFCTEGYRDLPFPSDDIGLGREGEPASFEGLISMLRSWSAVTTAKKQGVDLLEERVVKELEEEWGGASLVRKVTYKGFLLAGTPGPMSDD